MTLEQFLAYVLTPTGGAIIVAYLMAQVNALMILDVKVRRIVGLILCLVIPGLALGIEFALKLVAVITPETIFQVFATSFLIAQTLQLLAPAAPVTKATMVSKAAKWVW